MRVNTGKWMVGCAMVMPLVPAVMAVLPQMLMDSPSLQRSLTSWPLACKQAFTHDWQYFWIGAPAFTIPTIASCYFMLAVGLQLVTSQQRTLYYLKLHTGNVVTSLRVVLTTFLSTSIVVTLFLLRATSTGVQRWNHIDGLFKEEDDIPYLDIGDLLGSMYGLLFFLMLGWTQEGIYALKASVRGEYDPMEHKKLLVNTSEHSATELGTLRKLSDPEVVMPHPATLKPTILISGGQAVLKRRVSILERPVSSAVVPRVVDAPIKILPKNASLTQALPNAGTFEKDHYIAPLDSVQSTTNNTLVEAVERKSSLAVIDLCGGGRDVQKQLSITEETEPT
jgi:hypothetical protein